MVRKQFDLQKTKQAIQKEGLPFLPSAENFLKKYGGTHFIRYERRQTLRHVSKTMTPIILAHFDPIQTIENIDCKWFQHYSARIEKLVTPIGECGQGHASLMIDEDGAIYGGFDDSFGKIANSPEEAILELCDKTRKQWESIPDIEPLAWNPPDGGGGYLSIACPICKVPVGEECKYLPAEKKSESWRRPHVCRIDSAKENYGKSG